MLRNAPPTDDHVSPVETDAHRRRNLGIYYTPRSAAALLARWALRTRRDSVLEPSFGGCTILEAAVRRLTDLGCEEPSSQMSGFDIDKSAFGYLTRLLGVSNASAFRRCDFLGELPQGRLVTAVVANPPFVSYHRMDATQRQTVDTWRAQNECSFPRTASLWAYFLVHSLRFIEPGGRLAYVLPSASLTADYSSGVIDIVRRRFSRVTTVLVSQQLFIQAGAEERAVILLAEGYRPDGQRRCQVSNRVVKSLAEVELIVQSALGDLPQPTAAEAVPNGTQACNDLAEARQAGTFVELGTVAHARIGEVVGDVSFFVRPPDYWHAIGIGKKWLRPIVTQTRQLSGLRVTEADRDRAYGAIPLLLHAPSAALPKGVARYLRTYAKEAREANVTFGKRSPWHAVTYDSGAHAFIGSLSHNSPRIVVNAAGLSCANGLYKLTASSGASDALWLAIASQTTVFRLSAELVGRMRGSGALKLEPKDVHQLLIPRAPKAPKRRDLMGLLISLDHKVRRGEPEAATLEADQALLLDTKAIGPTTLRALRSHLQDLRGYRAPVRNRFAGNT